MEGRCAAASGDDDDEPPPDDGCDTTPEKARGVGMDSPDAALEGQQLPTAAMESKSWWAEDSIARSSTTGHRRSVITKRVRLADATKESDDDRRRLRNFTKTQVVAIAIILSEWFLRIWSKWFNNFTVFASIYELWSMGIWLAFLTETSMKDSLRWLLIADAIANTVVLADCTRILVRWLLEKRERRQRWIHHVQERLTKKLHHSNKEKARSQVAEAVEAKASKELTTKILPKLALALLMYPLQVGIDKILSGDRVPPYLVPLILVFRMSRVGWATLDSVRYINRKEMDVYVDIRIQGTVGSRSSSWQVIMKQFLIISFWGHWVGCLTYALRVLVDSPAFHDFIGPTRGLPRRDDGAREFFQKFAVEGNLVGYEAGLGFGSNYLVALYRGFAWNFEDVVPERPEDLILELITMACLVAIRSYCVGSFFKYQSLREMEQQCFTEQMESVNSFLDQCELPPSLKKAVIRHFEFQQEKRRDVQTLQVLANLPLEIRMNLREHEYLPVVVVRNHRLFAGLSADFGMQVCLLLQSQFMQPGETIFLEGDAPRELLFLAEGSIALSRYTQVGAGKATETLIKYLRSDRKEDPSIFGETAFLLEQSHLYSARVRAGAEAVILYINRQIFTDKLAAPFPEQHDLMMQNMAETFLLSIDGEDTVVLGKDRNAEQEGEHFQSMQEEVRKHLKERKESLNAKFSFAASTGDSDLVSAMLAKRVDPNISDYDKRSALHLAASEGVTDTISVILKANGDANVKDRWGSTPLQDALKNGFLGAAKKIFSHGGKFGLDDPSGLLCSCASDGDTPKMQQLLEFEIDVNAGDYDMRTALHLASTEGRLTVVAFLVSASADVNVKDRWNSTPLEDAIRGGFSIVANHLRQHGGRVDSTFAANLLCDAASDGNVAQLEMLVENGVDVSVGDYDQRTPLHLAAAEGQMLAVSFLLHVAHADHSPLDRWQATPLQDAISADHDDCLMSLLMKGAVLGPSATADEKKKVKQIHNTWCDGKGYAFSDSISRLRRQIASHSKLVRQGRARSDMFDTEAAGKFNRLLLHRQIEGLKDFSLAASHVMTVLRRLDELAVMPLTQMSRVLQDGAALASEGSFWENYKKLNRMQARNVGRSKDVQVGVFDQVAISTMSMGPIISDVIDRCVIRVLHEVEAIREDKMLVPKATVLRATPRGMSSTSASKQLREIKGQAMPKTPIMSTFAKHHGTNGLHAPQTPSMAPGAKSPNRKKKCPSLAEIVMRQLLDTLGWGERETDLSLEREAFTNSKEMLVPGSLKHQQELAHKLELLAATLLPGEHLSMTLQQSVFQDFLSDRFRKDILSYGSDWSAACNAHHAPASELAKWLQAHSNTVTYGGKAQEKVPVDMRPSIWQLNAFHPLLSLPKVSASQTQGGSDSAVPQTIVEEHVQLETYAAKMVHRNLVATELVILGLCVLILEEWEKPVEQKRPESIQLGMFGDDKRYSCRYGNIGSGSTIPSSLFKDLAAVFRKASSECQGASEVSEVKKKQLLEALRIAVRDAKRENKIERRKRRLAKHEKLEEEDKVDKEDVANVVHEKMSLDLDLDPGDDQIQMAILCGMKGEFDTDEFALLLDFADAPLSFSKPDKTGLFGAITRERFSFNLLRWILNHEERQKEMIEEAQRTFAVSGDCIAVPYLMGSNRSYGSLESLGEESCDTGSNLESYGLCENSRMSNGLAVGFSASDLELFMDADLAHDQVSQGQLSDDEDMKFDALMSDRGSLGMAFRKQGWTADNAQLKVPQNMGAIEDAKPMIANSTLSLEEETGKRATCRSCIKMVRSWMAGLFSGEAKRRTKKNRIARRFRELDEDGEGVGVVEVSQLIGDVFHHTLGQDQELRAAHRMFELLEKDEIGELVTLKDFLSVLPKLEGEIKDQQRKNARRNKSNASSAVMKVFAVMVVPPDAWWLRFWDFIKFVAVVYYLATVPIYFCFEAIDRLPDWQEEVRVVLDVFFDCFMVLNTMLNFFRSFLHPTKGFITNFQDIRVNYMLSFFFVDICACLPMDWISGSKSLATASHKGVLSRPRPLARLLRLLHMRQIVFDDHLELRHERRDLQKASNFVRASLDLLKFALALVHIIACLWWYLGARWDKFDPYTVLSGNNALDAMNMTRSSWIYEYEVVPGEEPLGVSSGPFWWQYLISFYWSAGRITQVGTVGNMWPGSLPEIAWCCILFLVAFAVQGYVDGILAGKVMATDESIIQALATSRIVEDYLHTVNLPDELADQIRSSAGATAAIQLTRRTEEVGASLPHLMKQRIASRAFLPYFEKSEAFRNCSRNFVIELGTCCKVNQVAKGTLLASVGEPALKMLILLRGRLALLDRQGRTFLETSRVGEMFGDVELIFDMRYEIGARAIEDSKYISLDRAGFTSTCQNYPTDRITVQKSVIDSLEGNKDHIHATSSENSQKEPSEAGDDKKSMAKSQASVGSSESGFSVLSLRQRIFMAELARVSEKTQAELKDAKQGVICRFIDMASEGDLEPVKAFTAKNEIKVDEADYDLRTALHLATCQGHMEIVKHLVNECGASLNVTDRFGNSPLDDALREKQKDVAQFLVDRGATFKADADVAGMMCQAAHDGDIDTLTMLLETVGINPNVADYDLRTPLHLGSSEGHSEVVQLLAALPKIDMNPKDRFGNTPLDDAIRHQHSGVRRLLQERGGVMGNSQLGVTLCTLAAQNDVDRLRELYESGVPMNQADYDYRTAQHLAASNGHVEVMIFLLNVARVLPNPLDRFMCTPLDDAIRHNRKAIEEMICEYGGLSGRAPEMAKEVENFRIRKNQEQEDKEREKLDRESNGLEIKSLAVSLSKFGDQSSFADDVNAYVNLAGVYRKILFLLLRHAATAVEKVEGEGEEQEVEFDKEGIERLLDTIAKGIEATAARLDTFFDRELLPWVNNLTSSQMRIAKLFMPSLQQLVERIQDHLKSRHEVVQAVQSLWVDGAKMYQCTPLGLISNRFKEGKADQLSFARLDALAMLWVTSTGNLEVEVAATAKLQRQHTASSLGSKGSAKLKVSSERGRGRRRQFQQLKGSTALDNLVHATM